MNPKVSFILSAYDRPKHLRCALASLQVQTEAEIEVLVADNGTKDFLAHVQSLIVEAFNDERFAYFNPRERTCYEATKALAPKCKGEWLVFGHDDGYYTPEFTERMLKCAVANPKAEFIYCDFLYDPRMFGEYGVCVARPQNGWIDKGGFLIRPATFAKFDWPPAPNDDRRDGLFVDSLVRAGVPMAKAPGIMWIHN